MMVQPSVRKRETIDYINKHYPASSNKNTKLNMEWKWPQSEKKKPIIETDKSPQKMARSIPQTKVKKPKWKSPQREVNNPKIKPIIGGKETEQVSPQTEVRRKRKYSQIVAKKLTT